MKHLRWERAEVVQERGRVRVYILPWGHHQSFVTDIRHLRFVLFCFFLNKGKGQDWAGWKIGEEAFGNRLQLNESTWNVQPNHRGQLQWLILASRKMTKQQKRCWKRATVIVNQSCFFVCFFLAQKLDSSLREALLAQFNQQKSNKFKRKMRERRKIKTKAREKKREREEGKLVLWSVISFQNFY